MERTKAPTAATPAEPVILSITGRACDTRYHPATPASVESWCAQSERLLPLLREEEEVFGRCLAVSSRGPQNDSCPCEV